MIERMIMYSLKQILEYMLGMSVIQVFPCWQEHPAHSAQSSFYNLQQTSGKIFLSLKKPKKLCLWRGIWNMLSKQQELFIIHQKGHTDNETRFLAIAKYFFPMPLQNKKWWVWGSLAAYPGSGVCQAGAVPRAVLVSGDTICPPSSSGMLQHKAPNHKPLLPGSGTEFGPMCPS